MIKPNELRIGNLLIKDDGLPERVATIYSNETIKFLGFDHPTALKACKPIPLTEELLLKAGFKEIKCDVEPNEATWYTGGQFTHKWIIALKCLDRKVIYYGGQRYKRVVFKYLHQLQNFYFAYTGEELQIKL